MRALNPVTTRFLGVILVSLGTVSCCPQGEVSAREEAFAQFLPSQDVNRSLKMELLGAQDTFDRAASIHFVVENVRAEDAIVLPHDFWPRGFYYDSEAEVWIELENAISYYPEIDSLLGAKGGELPSTRVLGFDPVESGVQLPIRLRVVVYGRIYRESEVTDEVVAAYAEVTISETASTGT